MLPLSTSMAGLLDSESINGLSHRFHGPFMDFELAYPTLLSNAFDPAG